MEIKNMRYTIRVAFFILQSQKGGGGNNQLFALYSGILRIK